MVLPLNVEIQQGIGGSIDADLLMGVTGAIAVTSVEVLSGVLTIGFLDETNMAQTATLTAVAGATDAASISVVVTSYGKNLESTDLNVQLALQRLSALILGDVHIAATYANLPAPGADYEDQTWYVKSTKRLFVCDGFTIFGVPPSGAFEDVAYATFTVYDRAPPPSLSGVGTRIYAIDQGHFLSRAGPAVAPFWAQVPPSLLLNSLRADPSLTVGFIGDFDNDQDALGAVAYSATHEFFYIRRHDHVLRRLTSYTAGSAGSSNYSWLLVADLESHITDEERALLNVLAGRTGVHQNLTFVEAGSVPENQFLMAGSPAGFIADLVEWDEDLYVVTFDGRASIRGGATIQLHPSSEFDNGVTRNQDYWFAVDGDEIRSIRASDQTDVQQFTWRTTGRADYVAMRLSVDPLDPDVLWQMCRTSLLDTQSSASLRIIVYAIAADGSLTEQDDIEITRAVLNAAVPGTYDDITSLVGKVDGYTQRPEEGVEAFGVEGDRLLIVITDVFLTTGQATHTLLAPFAIAGAPGSRTLTGVPAEAGVLADYFGLTGFVFRETDDDFYLAFDQEVKHFVPKGAAYTSPGDAHIYRVPLTATNLRLEGTASPSLPTTLFDDSLMVVTTPGDLSSLPSTVVTLHVDGTDYEWVSPHGVRISKALLSASTTYLLMYNGTAWVASHDYLATGFRDTYSVASGAPNAEANHLRAQEGNIWRTGVQGADIETLKTFIHNGGSSNRTFKLVLQAASYANGRYTLGEVYYVTPDADDFVVGGGNHELEKHFVTPLYILPNQLVLLATIRTDSTGNSNGGSREQTIVNPMGAFASDPDFDLDLTWRSELRITSLVPDRSNFGHGELTNTGAYYQEITYSTPGTQISDDQIAAAVGRSREIVSPMETGVLYIVVDPGGTGYNAIPGVSVAGVGGIGAAAVAVLDGDSVGAVLVTVRGRDFTDPPTIVFSGGGGSGAAATGFVGRYSTINSGLHGIMMTPLAALRQRPSICPAGWSMATKTSSAT